MGKITKLQVQKRNKERVNVFVDGTYAFSVNLIAAAKLRRGQELSGPEMIALKEDGEVHLAYQRAVRFLGFRPRSISEVRRYLTKKGDSGAVVDDAIARLERKGYLDDRAFARFWIENREQFRPRGRRALAYELRQKGVSADVIEEALEGFEEEDAAWASLEKRLQRWASLDEYEFTQRVMGYLSRRGFAYDVSRESAERAWEELNSEK